VLERDDFHKRFDQGQPISVHELMYSLMQGYDSVAIRADVEIGATEQKFNLLVGREMQRIHGQPQQVILTVPVLPGLDGVQRMSKSLGNYIGVSEPPGEMFGKVMRLPDSVMLTFWRLVTDAEPAEIASIERELADGANPKDIKERLGERVVWLYHGEEAARAARRDFATQFSRREVPEHLETFGRGEVMAVLGKVPKPGIVEFLHGSGIAASKSAARRLIQQGAVQLDGERITDPDLAVDSDREHVLRAGRKMKRYKP